MIATTPVKPQTIHSEPPKKKSKYGNSKVESDGIKFDSIKERNRYHQLKSDSNIRELEHQVTYRIEINGKLVCRYIADFRYKVDGVTVVEDVKSAITKKNPVYRIKNKLMKAVFGVDILES